MKMKKRILAVLMATLMIFGIAIPTTAIDVDAATVNIDFSGRIQIPNTVQDRWQVPH